MRGIHDGFMGFNGAAARVQRNGDAGLSSNCSIRLQWGRCSCAAECRLSCDVSTLLGAASMGPLLVCSGMEPHRVVSLGTELRFNGAAARVQRNVRILKPNRRGHNRFNGAAARVQRNDLPRLDWMVIADALQWGRCSCAAECSMWNDLSPGTQELQWGRCSCAAEWNIIRTSASIAYDASMGPLLVCSGMCSSQMQDSETDADASMGPLLVCSGMRLPHGHTARQGQSLQWGRCSCAAEWISPSGRDA